MKLVGVENIFFDLDHTLWDFDKNSALTFDHILKRNEIEVDLHSFLEAYQPINTNYWRLYREEKVTKNQLRFARLNETFKVLGIAISNKLVRKLSEDYITFLSSYNHLIDGALPILEYLSKRFQLHIITNGFKEVQQQKLNASGIDHYFLTVTNSEMVGVKKPNPKIFKYALSVARATVMDSLMIGDNLEADVYGALDFGIQAICFNYHKEIIPKEILSINRLTELKKYL
jgi:putative hydrolase of the HAD superfamily